METLFCKWFTDDFAVLRPNECTASLPLTAQNRRRESRHCAGRDRSRTRGAVTLLETNSNWTIAKVFSKKVARFVSMYLLWEKSRQKGLKVAKYWKSRSCVWEAGADGSGRWILLQPATNKERELVCGSVYSSWAHRTSSVKRVGRGEIFN